MLGIRDSLVVDTAWQTDWETNQFGDSKSYHQVLFCGRTITLTMYYVSASIIYIYLLKN